MEPLFLDVNNSESVSQQTTSFLSEVSSSYFPSILYCSGMCQIARLLYVFTRIAKYFIFDLSPSFSFFPFCMFIVFCIEINTLDFKNKTMGSQLGYLLPYFFYLLIPLLSNYIYTNIKDRTSQVAEIH